MTRLIRGVLRRMNTMLYISWKFGDLCNTTSLQVRTQGSNLFLVSCCVFIFDHHLLDAIPPLIDINHLVKKKEVTKSGNIRPMQMFEDKLEFI